MVASRFAPADAASTTFLDAQQRQGRAALHRLRLGRRRQVDPDRPPPARHQAALRRPARGARTRPRAGTARTGDGLDFALLVDGLAAEREQGITIDVAYRFFSTETRTFIVADTPGHEQYTRNMATGASTADLAVLLVDARQGLTRADPAPRLLVSMLGIRQRRARDQQDGPRRLVARSATRRSWREFEAFAARARLRDGRRHPALGAQRRQRRAAGGRGALVRRPDAAAISRAGARPARGAPRRGPFRMPVQWVNRPRRDFPRLCRASSRAASSRVGDRVRVAALRPRDARSRASSPSTATSPRRRPDSRSPSSSRTTSTPPAATSSRPPARRRPSRDALDARLFWIGEEPLERRRRPAPQARHRDRRRHASRPSASRIDPDTGRGERGRRACAPTTSARSRSALDRPLAVRPLRAQRETGSFILIDRESADTVGLGLVRRSVPTAAPESARDAIDDQRPAFLRRRSPPSRRRRAAPAFSVTRRIAPASSPRPAPPSRQTRAPQRLLRSDARALPRDQPGLRRGLEEPRPARR